MSSDPRKQFVSLDPTDLAEIRAEALRLERPISWVMRRAFEIARNDIRSLPTVNHVDADEFDDEPTLEGPAYVSEVA